MPLRIRAGLPFCPKLFDSFLLARDLTYNETDALAKQQEADFLYRAMQTDLVDQVMRRLAAVAF